MVETKIDGNYKVGISRLRYLDTCNFKFIQGDIDAAKQSIDAFLNTVKDNTDAGIQLKKDIETVEENRTKAHNELRDEIEKKGFLEQSISWNDGHGQIDFESLLDLKAFCWAAALEYGLFNE